MNKEEQVPTVDTLQPFYIAQAMQLRGGGFMKHLGAALQVADSHNARLILSTWRLQINKCIEIWWDYDTEFLKPENYLKP